MVCNRRVVQDLREKRKKKQKYHIRLLEPLVTNALVSGMRKAEGTVGYYSPSKFVSAHALLGPTPPELGDLLHLRILFLSSNELSGEW